MFLFYVSYSFGFSRHHVPWTKMAGAELRYADVERGKVLEEEMERGGTIERSLDKAIETVGEGISLALETGAFMVQFLDWWYSSSSKPAPSEELTLASIPDPPEVSPEVSRVKCPLCRGPRTNDCVLPVSGYVFCYVCIVKHLRAEGRCPVTKFPAKEEQLIRIYDGK